MSPITIVHICILHVFPGIYIHAVMVSNLQWILRWCIFRRHQSDHV